MSAVPSARAAEPIEGRWAMAGGKLEIRASGDGFANRWLKQRPGISCPRTDDQDGDMRLRGRGRRYSGAWAWVQRKPSGACVPIGRGPMTVSVSANGRRARLEADPPPGWRDHQSYRLRRIGRLRLARLSGWQRRLLDRPWPPVEQLGAVPPLRRFPFPERAQFAR
jgi:hypothetical protein